jgi:hypothetical protein
VSDDYLDLVALEERPDALELTLARAAYRDVLDALAQAAAFTAIDDFVG